MKSKFIKFFLGFILTFFCFINIGQTFAEDDSWTIIPKTEQDIGSQSAEVGKEAGKVWENYNTIGEGNSDIGAAFGSGIFSWNTIFGFLKHIAKVLSEIGLVIGAGMIIYAGYKYATGVFTGDASKGGQDAIKGAIYGILIVIFSYAIMKILLAMFL